MQVKEVVRKITIVDKLSTSINSAVGKCDDNPLLNASQLQVSFRASLHPSRIFLNPKNFFESEELFEFLLIIFAIIYQFDRNEIFYQMIDFTFKMI